MHGNIIAYDHRRHDNLSPVTADSRVKTYKRSKKSYPNSNVLSHDWNNDMGKKATVGKGVYYLTDPGSGTSYLTVLNGPNVLISGTGFKRPTPRHGPLAHGNVRQKKKFLLAQKKRAHIQLQQTQLQYPAYPPRLAALPDRQYELGSNNDGWRAEDEISPVLFSTVRPSTDPESYLNSLKSDTSKKVQNHSIMVPGSPIRTVQSKLQRLASSSSTARSLDKDVVPDSPLQKAWFQKLGVVNATESRQMQILDTFDQEMKLCMAKSQELKEESVETSRQAPMSQHKLNSSKKESNLSLGRGIFDSQASFPTLYKDKVGLAPVKKAHHKVQKKLGEFTHKSSQSTISLNKRMHVPSLSGKKKSSKRSPDQRHKRKQTKSMEKYKQKYEKLTDRKKDCELYFFLANRYGALSEYEFFLTETPGKFFVMRIRAAIKLIAHFWRHVACPVARSRHVKGQLQDEASIKVQAFMRMVAKRTKYLKVQEMGFWNWLRRVTRKCWIAWKKQTYAGRVVKQLLCKVQTREVAICLHEWRRWLKVLHHRREELVLANLKRGLLRTQRKLFGAWTKYSDTMKHVKEMCRRNIICPSFFSWKAYVTSRRCHRGIVKFQAIVRGVRCRNRFNKTVNLKNALQILVRMHLSFKSMRRKRDEDVRKYIMERRDLTTSALVHNELERLKQAKEECKKAEQQTYEGFDDWLKNVEGKELLRYELKLEMAKKKNDIMDDTFKQNCKQRVKRKLLQQVLATARANTLHDFDLHKPPQFKCADPNCQATFILKEHYEMHVKTAPAHLTLGNFVDLHLALLEEDFGAVILEQYVRDSEDVLGTGVFSLDLWLGVAKWKEFTTDDELFRKKAKHLFKSFTSKKYIPQALISDDEQQLITEPFLQYKHIENYLNSGNKFKQKTVYIAPQRVPLSVGIFDNAQWAAFKYLLDNVWDPFLESSYGQKYIRGRNAREMEYIETGTKQFLNERRSGYLHEAKTLKKNIKQRRTMEKENQYFESLRSMNCSFKTDANEDGFIYAP